MAFSDYMKITPEDNKLAVKIELKQEELKYLEKLLNCEMVYQVRNVIDSQTKNTEKVVKLLSLFECFRCLDDQLLDFIWAMKKYKKQAEVAGLKNQDLFLLSQGVCKVYGILVNETIKMTLTEEITKMKEQYNDILVNKIDHAIKHSFDPAEHPDFKDLVKKKSKSVKPEIKKEPEKKDPVLDMVNMFKKGLA